METISVQVSPISYGFDSTIIIQFRLVHLPITYSMGLCKCPKKVVTTLFCYEHRVNVCESCLVSNHPSCIIQTYYKWLQDSEYDPKCSLCSEDLAIRECVRLTCFHVFHWKCFQRFLDDYPKTTAPAGYKCPSCHIGIFPGPHFTSPVANELRKKFSTMGWCEAAGAPEMHQAGYQQRIGDNVLVGTSSRDKELLLHMEPVPLARNERVSLNFDSMFKQNRSVKNQSSTLYTIDEDTKKYRRRRPLTFRQSLNQLRRSPYCKFIFLIFFTLFVLCVLFVTVIPTEFEDEAAFKRIIELKERADRSQTELLIYGEQ